MDDIFVLEDFDLTIEVDEVFRVIKLKKDSSVYQEVYNICEEISAEICKEIEPKVIFRKGKNMEEISDKEYQECEESLYIVATLGKRVVKLMTKYFNNNKYVEGFLIDIILDKLLFQLSDKSLRCIKQILKCEGYKISIKLSPGTEIPTKIQGKILDKLEVKGMGITTGYMLTPIKSLSYIIGLNKDIKCDCKKYNYGRCLWRKRKVKYAN